MNEDRFVLSDEVWLRVEPLLVEKSGDRGATGTNNRLFMEALLWRVRTGTPWRDLPTNFGNRNSTFRRFHRWADAGIFESLFQSLSGTRNFEYAMIDGTIVSVHQKATGAKGGLCVKRLVAHAAD